MKNMLLVRLVPAAAALTLATLSTAHAADSVLLSSTVTLSNLTYQLIDLDPTDGITPWVTFATHGYMYAGNSSALSDGTAAAPNFDSTAGIGTNQPLTTTSTDGASFALAGPTQIQAHSSIRASEVLNPNTAIYQSSLDKTSTVNSFNGSDPNTGDPVPSVSLSANTLLIIKGTANVQETMDFTALLQAISAAGGSSYMSIQAHATANADASLLNTTNINGDPTQGTNALGASLYISAPSMWVDGVIHATPQEGDLSLTSSFESGANPFKLTLANTDSANMQADLSASVLAMTGIDMTHVSVPPPQPVVPEPSTYLLTGLGLITAGAIARKRNSAAH